MEQKNSNATLIIIALTVIVIVAMVCGMVMWIMTRTMAMNERLLEVRLAEAKQQQQVVQPTPPQQTPVAQPTPEPKQQPAAKPVAKRQPVKKPEDKPTVRKTEQKKPATKSETKPATKPATKKPEAKPEPKKTEPKRLVPQETPEGRAKVGPDGLPLDRITLPVGNDDLDWQF